MCPRLHGKGYGGRTDAFWCWLTTTTELAAESMRARTALSSSTRSLLLERALSCSLEQESAYGKVALASGCHRACSEYDLIFAEKQMKDGKWK